MNTKNSRKNFNGFRSFYSFFIGFLLLVLSVGDVVGQTATITITQTSSGITATGYDSGAERTWTQSGVSFGAKAAMKQSGQTRLQFQSNNGVIYNTTPLPGKIISITINQTGTEVSNLTAGSSTRLVNSTSGNYTASGTTVGSSSSTGWSSVNFTSVAYTYFAIKRGGTVSYASSIVIEYKLPTVTFDKNALDATGLMADQFSSSSANLNSIGYSRTGYSFAGWSTTPTGAVSYINEASYPFTADATLYAQWTPTSGSNVTFNANGGTGAMAQQNASSATDLTANAFTRSGYTFTGWNTAADGSGTAYVDEQSYSFASDLTLYAQWSPNNNTLSFDGNGATGGSMASQTVATDASITLPGNTFTRTGYTFAGWATTAGGVVEYANAVAFTMVATNTTLFAKWTAINYTVTFNGNGSTAGSMSNQTIAAFATANLTTNAFTRTGFTFSGWNTVVDGSGTSYADGASYTMGTANVTLYAQWVVFVGPCFEEFAITTSTFARSNSTTVASSSTALRLASGSNSGSISTGSLSGISGNITFKAEVRGWSTSEDQFTVNLGGVIATGNVVSTFANTDVSTAFEWVEIVLNSVPLNPTLVISCIAGERVTFRNIQLFCPPSVPTLTATPTTLSNLNYTVGFGPSAVQTFNVTGTNLDGSDVDLVLGNNDFEISSDNVSFSDILTLPAFSGASQPIYVRLKSGLAVNAYADVILIAGGGVALADEPEVSVAGNVTAVITPVLTSSLAESVVYGSSVSYQITANNTPTSFGAINLPTGLSINASGLISGTITASVGTVNTTISATNGAGTDSETLVWTITPKALTLSGLSGTNKEYDGNTSATLSGTGILTGIVGADAVTLSGTPTGTFTNKNVGTNKTITVSGYTLSGAQAGNYTLTQPTGLTANITQRSVTVTGATAQDKVYNGTTAASITGATLVGIISPDVVTVSGGGTFATANAGTGIAVTATLSLGGVDAGNYAVTQPTGLSANITKANPVFTTSPIAVTVGGTYNLPGANISSTSDGALSYTITAGGNATLAGTTITGAVVGTETLTVNQAASANYNAGSTTVVVNVTTITYNHGDFRTLTVGKWSYNTTPPADATQWERYNSAIPGWEVYSGQPPKTVVHKAYVTKNTEIPTNATPNGNSIVIVMKDPITNIPPTLTFNCSNEWTFKGLRLEEGSAVQMNAKFSINSGDEFEIKDGATFVFNYGSNGNPASGLGLWNGVEKFHPTSNFRVTDHTSVSSEFFLPPASSFSSNAFSGVTAYFGNLKFESVDEVFLTTTNLSSSTIYLTHSDFEVISPVNYRFIHGNGTWIVGRDLKISGPLTITTGANTINLECKRDFIKESSSVFRLVNNPTGNVTLTVNGDTQINAGSVCGSQSSKWWNRYSKHER